MNFIFDVDGTLVDSYPCIMEKVKICNDKLGINYPLDFVYEYIIKTSLSGYIEFLSRNPEIDAELYRTTINNTKENIEKITLLPEVKETLEALKNKGHRLFIYTHRGVTLPPILKRLEIDQYFEDIVDSTMNIPRKPSGSGVTYLLKKHNVPQNDACYVGDRDIDIGCAKDAGVISVFYNSSGIKPATKPDLSIQNFSELINLF